MLVGIFGTGRNGSTLLMRLLDGSPDLWVHPVEVNYLSVYSDLLQYGRVKPLTAVNARDSKPLMLEGKLPGDLLLKIFGWHAKEVDDTYLKHLKDPVAIKSDPLQKISPEAKYTASEFLNVFLDSVRSAYDDRSCRPKYYVIKSIETPYIEEYENVFQEMRFVHIVRDPLATYSSLKRTNMIIKGWPFWRHGGDELRMFLEKRWLPHARFIVNRCVTGNDRHFWVRYEDLCSKPEETVLGICRWLGITPPTDPTLQTVLGGKRMIELPSNPSEKGVKTPFRAVSNMAEKFGYRDVLTDRERAFIVYRTYPLARPLGYFVGEGGRLPTRMHLARQWFLPDAWERMNARSAFRLMTALIRRRCYIYSKLSPFSWRPGDEILHG